VYGFQAVSKQSNQPTGFGSSFDQLSTISCDPNEHQSRTREVSNVRFLFLLSPVHDMVLIRAFLNPDFDVDRIILARGEIGAE